MTQSGSLTSESAEGTEVSFHPESTGYDVTAFTAPTGGVYRFTLFGSGGLTPPVDASPVSISPGGAGGKTVGYLLMKAGETVYIGAGGCDCAAFVSKSGGASLEAIGRENMYYIAGGGGEGGANYGAEYGLKSSAGGVGGGGTGGSSSGVWSDGEYGIGGNLDGARGGMQTSGNTYQNWEDMSFYMGLGGHGYYAGTQGSKGSGGGGGSGLCWSGSVVTLRGETYVSTSEQGTGSAGGQWGYAVVAFVKRDILPIRFDGTALTEIFFNGVKLTGLIYNGVRVFIRKVKQCFAQDADRLSLRRATRA